MSHEPKHLFSLRSAVILGFSIVAAENAGFLAFVAHRSLPEAVIAGAMVLGSVFALLAQAVGD